jgi:hypothetical protein
MKPVEQCAICLSCLHFETINLQHVFGQATPDLSSSRSESKKIES